MLFDPPHEELSDEEIAAEIDLSRDGMKKRWQHIFEVVRDVDAALLDGRSNETQGKRGAELRQVVITYVRNHRSELHAWDRTAKVPF